MKTKYFFAVLLVCFCYNVNAQFMDDMEYPNGIPASSTWWDCNAGCPVIVGPDAGHNSNYAGSVPSDGMADFSLNLGVRTTGTWGLSFYMRIPQNKVGYWNLQAVIPFTTPEWPIGNIYFNDQQLNPGQGFIDWNTVLDTTDDTFFNFPHDTWFRVLMNFDFTGGMAAATFSMSVNNVVVLPPGTPFRDGDGNIPSSLGGVNFNSISTDLELYIDDFIFTNSVLGIEDNTLAKFSVYPNPAKEELNIVYEEEVSEIKIYDLNGRVVSEGISEKIINVSKLGSGVYFIELVSGSSKSVRKFIKE